MSKKSDDSIERIFRQALTQYDNTFRESDWLKMEKMLNEEDGRRALARSKRIRGISYTLTGLTVLFIAVYFLAFNPSHSIARLNNSATESEAEGDLKIKGNVMNENSPDGLLSVSKDSGAQASDAQGSQNAIKKVPLPGDAAISASSEKSGPKKIDTKKFEAKQNAEIGGAIKKRRSSQHQTGFLPTRENNDQSRKQKKALLSSIAAKEEQHVSNGPELIERQRSGFSSATGNPISATGDDNKTSQEMRTGGNAAQTTEENVKIEEQRSNDEMKERQSSSESTDIVSQKSSSVSGLTSEPNGIQLLQPSELKKDTVDELENASNATEPVKNISEPAGTKEKKNLISRWSIGVVLAPEFSTIRLNHYSAPGEAIGLRLGYQLSRRFNVSTGVIRSAKKYKDSAAEYNPATGYWKKRTNGVVPQEIDSKCLVYEIPLELQFNVIETIKSRLFISTGVSSYLMASQSYKYSFESPNPGADSGWETSQTEAYWFGVGMISAGYERYVSRSFALGIEPYLKTSMTEIGWPNIKLFSAGAYVTLRYRFMNKENRMVTIK